ncbi:MAG TPA: tetratricopeptide repeat protein, partial [Bradyrhizobium sp.]|nr:tetratricopeptide repeat protein [Bradyrhizobium sp.]
MVKSEPPKNPREPRLGTVEELARVMLRHRSGGNSFSPVIFFVGAGCSVSAGVPTGAMIAKERTCYLSRKYNCMETADPVQAYNAMVRANHFRLPSAATSATPAADLTDAQIDWGHTYDQIFDEHIRAAPEIRDYFGSICAEDKVRMNWSHLCLGELMRRKDVSTIITTNFDQLVLRGLVHAGIVPSVSDGLEALNRVDPSLRFAQLIELHGSRHTYTLRNSKADVAAVKSDAGAPSTLNALFGSSRLFVVVGYAGREVGVMDLLIEAGKLYPDHEIVWVMHEASPAKLGDQARYFLATSQHGRLIVGQDSDEFFLHLCQALNVGTPRALADPVAGLDGLMANLAAHSDQNIAQEVERARKGLNFLKEAYGRFLSEQSELEKILRQAQEHFLAGEYQTQFDLLDPVADRLSEPRLWEMLGDAAYELGKGHPEQNYLRRSVEAYKSISPASRAAICLKLADALQNLGVRESETARLEEAVAAYRAALQEYTRDHFPLDWAKTQNNLAAALSRLGERESRTARLDEAVSAYRAALQEYTRDRVPLDWAMTQNNLGNALWALGGRESGTARLEEAVVAFREALQEYTRERVPVEWAMTQNNLGNALQALGERENGIARLEEAVAAYRAALQEYNRERAPLEWAAMQNNLGSALSSLGERESGMERLEEAVVAYRAALQERTRERVPLDWAMTQNNLGTALWALGARESGTVRLEEAVAAYRAA